MRLPDFRSLGLEAAAFARQAWLLRHDVGAPSVPSANAGDDVVVFLHGILATAGVLRPLRAAVERHDRVHSAALTYAPGPGVEALAARLASLTAELPSDVRLHLVGHSLGGVVARHHAVHASDPRIVETISLASPFAGLRSAGLLPLAFARDLDPDGPLLRALRLASSSSMPHLSIVAAEDAMIPAPVTQALPFGEVVVLDHLGHNAMLFDPRVARLIEAKVLASRRSNQTSV